MAPDGLRADDFNAVVPTLGTLVGAGTIDAKNNLDFKMVATLTKSAGGATGAAAATGGTGSAGGTAGILGGLLGKIPGGGGGSTASAGQRIPFMIEGTTADPKFVPDVKGIAASMLKSKLGSLVSPSSTSPQQQNTNNPLSGLGGLFQKKKP